MHIFFDKLSIQNSLSNWLFSYYSFPGSSDGKQSTCNAGDPGLIPGLGRSLFKLYVLFAYFRHKPFIRYVSANFCPFFDFFKSWSIVDLQCISFRYTAQWFETHTLTHYIFFIHSSVNRHSGCFLLGISFIELKFFILIKADLSTFSFMAYAFLFYIYKIIIKPKATRLSCLF